MTDAEILASRKPTPENSRAATWDIDPMCSSGILYLRGFTVGDPIEVFTTIDGSGIVRQGMYGGIDKDNKLLLFLYPAEHKRRTGFFAYAFDMTYQEVVLDTWMLKNVKLRRLVIT